MHSTTELVAQASAAGLVTRREVQEGMVTVRSASNGGREHAILVRNQPVGVVKQLSHVTGADAALVRERRALRCVREIELGPRLLSAQPGDGLWLRAVRGVELGRTSGTVPELAEVCEQWGVRLAQLHRLRSTQPDAVEAPRPWLLNPQRRARTAAAAGERSLAGELLATIEREPALRRALGQVESRWTDRHWVHGDLRPANVRVELASPVRVHFVNFEQAGLGDPAWDLASAVDCIVGLAGRWGSPSGCLTDYLLRGYRRADGPGVLYPAIQAVGALAAAWAQAGPPVDGKLVDPGAADAPDAPGAADSAVLRSWLDRARSFAERAARRPGLAA